MRFEDSSNPCMNSGNGATNAPVVGHFVITARSVYQDPALARRRLGWDHRCPSDTVMTSTVAVGPASVAVAVGFGP